MRRLRRYGRLARVFAGASISAQLEYRANFVISLLNALLTAGGALFGLFVLYGDGQPLGGWTYREATVVVGLYTFVQGYIGALLQPNLNLIGETIRLGTMDFTLLKPIDAQFLVSTRNVNIFRLTDVVIGLGVTIWAATGLAGTTALGLLGGALLIITALLIVYAVWFMLTTTAFWFVKIANLTDLFSSLFRAGQMPVSAFSGWVRVLFTFLVPVAFITTVPAEAVIGRANAAGILGAVVIAAVLLIAARLFWRYAVSTYTSASS